MGPISYKVALFTSLIFISHPIQTQSVTYIVQRMASMAGMFYLLTFVLYIKGRLSKGKARFFCFGGAVLSYLLGVFSKENVAILPFFIALYEFYFFQNLDLSPKGKKILCDPHRSPPRPGSLWVSSSGVSGISRSPSKAINTERLPCLRECSPSFESSCTT